MTEDDFFFRMEYRICSELAGMREKGLHAFWCDGFMPNREFAVVGDQSQISGRVWIANGSREQSCWDFTLLFGYRVPDRESINWDWNMPDERLTGWLSMDFEERRLKIDLLAASPDHSPAPD